MSQDHIQPVLNGNSSVKLSFAVSFLGVHFLKLIPWLIFCISPHDTIRKFKLSCLRSQVHCCFCLSLCCLFSCWQNLKHYSSESQSSGVLGVTSPHKLVKLLIKRYQDIISDVWVARSTPPPHPLSKLFCVPLNKYGYFSTLPHGITNSFFSQGLSAADGWRQ